MTLKLTVLAVAALGAWVALGTSAAPVSDDQPGFERLVWRTPRSDGFAEALSVSTVADRQGASVLTVRDLILTPARGRLVLTQTTYMRHDLARIRLLDEKTGWWVQLETSTGLDHGSWEHQVQQNRQEMEEQFARERKADAWRTFALTGTGGLRFSSRAKANDAAGSSKRALALAVAITQSPLLDGSSASPVGEELIFLHALWPRFHDPRPVPELVELIAALHAALPMTPGLEQADRTYADSSWEQLKKSFATGINGGRDKAAADAFIRQFKSVSPANPLADAAH